MASLFYTQQSLTIGSADLSATPLAALLGGKDSELPMDFECPHCGYVEGGNAEVLPKFPFRPWHVRGRGAVKAYVESLGEEAHEWLLALYVDEYLQLLAVDTVARGNISGVEVPTWQILERGRALGAAGFILVHNHPSGDVRPSRGDIQATRKLAHVSHELNVPLLDHLIVAGDELREIGEWHWGGTSAPAQAR